MLTTNILLSALVPLAVLVYLIVHLLKKQVKWLKTKKGKRLVPFLPLIVGALLGAIPGLVDSFLIPVAMGIHLPWHVALILGIFGGLLSHAIHGWIHKGLRGE